MYVSDLFPIRLLLRRDLHNRAFALISTSVISTIPETFRQGFPVDMLSRSLFAIVCLLPLYVQAADRTINEWTALGDSYASGVGAGEQPADDTNRCFRFPNAYPAVMQSGPGSLQPNPLIWNNVACSGNTASQILDKEFLDQPEDDGKNGIRPVWGDKPEFVTINMVGNDIGILNLVTTCILPFKLWGLNCDQVIQEGMKIAQSDELKANFTAIIEKAYY